MNRVLITGASGFVGRHCVPLLLERDCAVHAVVGPRRAAGPANLPGFAAAGSGEQDLMIHAVDLHDATAIARLLAEAQPTHLLHLAWNATPGEFWTTPENLDWVATSLRLVRSFVEQGGRRVVVAGTCAEYAPSDWPLHEASSPCTPLTLYGASKHHLHQLLAGYCEPLGVNLAWARLFGLYGPHEHPRRIVASTLRALLSGEPVRCTAGQQERDFLHVRDAADALTTLLLSDLTGAINVGSGQAVRIADLVQRLSQIANSGAAIELGAQSPPVQESPRVVADVTRLRNELGWRPSLTLHEGLAHAAAWWRSRGGETNRSAALGVQSSVNRKAAPRVLCPTCGAGDPVRWLHRPSVPVHQNLPLDAAAEARSVPRGVLDLRWCSKCGFGFNAAFDADLCRYGARYDNTQTHSPRFEAHVEQLAQRLVHERGVRNCRVVEVGCGQADFLKRLVSNPLFGNTGIGFDPAYTGPATDCDGRLTAQRRYFDAAAGVEADVVVCRHVIEHVPRPVEFLQSIAAAMQAGRGRRLFLETPALEWILEHQVVWDLFYEHCSLFTATGLTTALQRAGFGEVEVTRVFGGQYLWAEALLQESACCPTPVLRRLSNRLTQQAAAFGTQADRQLREWQELVEQRNRRGPVAVWGAGAKGVTFCHLVDPDAGRLSGLVDINPGKQGKFAPGTGHRIYSPAEWSGQRGSVLVLNPNYFDEIRAELQSLHSTVEPINLMSREAAA